MLLSALRSNISNHLTVVCLCVLFTLPSVFIQLNVFPKVYLSWICHLCLHYLSEPGGHHLINKSLTPSKRWRWSYWWRLVWAWTIYTLAIKIQWRIKIVSGICIGLGLSCNKHLNLLILQDAMHAHFIHVSYMQHVCRTWSGFAWYGSKRSYFKKSHPSIHLSSFRFNLLCFWARRDI